MAHVHAFGEQAPTARPYLHLGATSAFVTDNADLIVMRDGLRLLLGRLIAVLRRAGDASPAARRPCPAWPTPTSSRRSSPRSASGPRSGCRTSGSTWKSSPTGSDSLRFRGCKGTTGTQAAFLELFAGRPRQGPRAGAAGHREARLPGPVRGDGADLPAQGRQHGARRAERHRPVGRQDGGRPPPAAARGRAARAVRDRADRVQRHGLQAESDAGRADQRARPVRDLAPGQRRSHRGRPVAGADARRQRQPPAGPAGGVPRPPTRSSSSPPTSRPGSRCGRT